MLQTADVLMFAEITIPLLSDSCCVCLLPACLHLFLQVGEQEQSVISERRFTWSGPAFKSSSAQCLSLALPLQQPCFS